MSIAKTDHGHKVSSNHENQANEGLPRKNQRKKGSRSLPATSRQPNQSLLQCWRSKGNVDQVKVDQPNEEASLL